MLNLKRGVLMYRLISDKEINKVKEILMTTDLKESLIFDPNDVGYYVNINGNHIKEHVHFTYDKAREVLFHKGKSYGIDYQLDHNKIVFSSDKFRDHCFQVDLNLVLKDDDSLYFVKNISNLAGKGAISRLYRGLGHNKEIKYYRRDQLVNELAGDCINYKNKKWLVYHQININDLYNKDLQESLYSRMMESFLRILLLIEKISRIKHY